MTDAHTIAWKMLHAELRRRAGPGHEGSQGRDPEAQTCARLYEQARAAGIKPLDVMVELARLVVRFAKMTRNPVGAAEQVERSVLAD